MTYPPPNDAQKILVERNVYLSSESSCWGCKGNTIESCLCCMLFCGWVRVVMMMMMKVMVVMMIIISVVCFHLRITKHLILHSSHRMLHLIILQFPAVCCILVFNFLWTPDSHRLFATNRSYKGSTFSRKKTGDHPWRGFVAHCVSAVL